MNWFFLRWGSHIKNKKKLLANNTNKEETQDK